MKAIAAAIGKLFVVGGWAPILVFGVHAVGGLVLRVYEIWPRIDIPMHFAGGVAIAIFTSGCFNALPRGEVDRSRVVVLEMILVGSLTATAAVLWEFAEFAADRLFHVGFQISLANTMQDLAMGVIGAATFIALRIFKLGLGHGEVLALADEWLRGEGTRTAATR
jgi:hypothetical protein